MAVLWNSKSATLVVASLVLVLVLMAEQGWCWPNDAEDSDYNNDDPAYDDEDDDEDVHTGPPPVFITRPANMSASSGDTVVLDCDIQNALSFVKIWLNGSETLILDNLKLSEDPRVHRLDNNSLRLTSLHPWDSGAYTCQIGSNPVLNLTHHLVVNSPAVITKFTPIGASKTLKAGEMMILTCATSGFPEPMVTWTKENKKLPNGKKMGDGRMLKIENLNRHHAGTYQCKAENGIGSPVMHSINIVVSYTPEIVVENEIVRSGDGEEVDLVCIVHAEPSAKVLWQKAGQTVAKSDRVALTNDGSMHTLKIKRLQKEDFGKYTCFAKNSIGQAQQEVELSGLPDIPRFITERQEGDMGVVLEWAVVSFTPITEYELQYRRKTSPKWEKAHPVVENPEGNVYSVKQGLTQLISGEYEVVLRAKNGYGWSESPIQVFLQNDNGAPAAETSIGEPDSSAAHLKSAVLALLMLMYLQTLFL